MVKAFADLSNLKENDRIDVIGKYLMNSPKGSGDKPLMAGVIVDNNEVADRYIEKMAKKFPKVRVVRRDDGPIAGAVTIGFGEPLR